MASLLGFLGALGDSLGIGGNTQQPGALTRFNDSVDPAAAAARAQGNADQSALAQFAQMRQNGVTDPRQYMTAAAQYSPAAADKAVTLQAQNPLLAFAQQNQVPTSQRDPNADASLPWSTQAQPAQAATGDDILKSLPPSIATQVKAIAEGKIAIPTGRAGQSPYWQQMLNIVGQYDPSFDATNYNARAATRKDFTSGKSAQNITSLNTAMGHLSSLSDAYDKLGNTGSPIYNTVANGIQNAIGLTDAQKATQTATADVGTKAHAVSEELAKVFRSTGMAESDVKAWEGKIDTSSSPAQSKAVIQAAIELMNSRLDSLGQQYNQGMGTSKNGIELLSPHAQAAYLKLTGSAPAQTTASGNMAADNAAQTALAPTVQTATNPKTGEKLQLVSGKWVPVK